MIRFFLLLLCLFVPSAALAQVDPASLPTSLDWSESLRLILQSVGGLKGAGGLTIAAAVVQILMYLARSPLGDLAGKWKLLIFSALSLVAGVVTLKANGVDWVGSLVHSTTLTAIGVFVSQVIKQTKKAD